MKAENGRYIYKLFWISPVNGSSWAVFEIDHEKKNSKGKQLSIPFKTERRCKEYINKLLEKHKTNNVNETIK